MGHLKKVLLVGAVLGVAALSVAAKNRWSTARDQNGAEGDNDKNPGKGKKPFLRQHPTTSAAE